MIVIGILIALQVNNWNWVRKDRKLEHEFLIRLHENMLSSFKNVKENIKEVMNYIAARVSPHIDSRVVIRHVNEKKHFTPINEGKSARLYRFDFSALSKDPRVISAISTMNHVSRVLYNQNEELENIYKHIISLLEQQLSHYKK